MPTSRTIRLAVAALAVAGAVAPGLASAEPPPPRPVCHLEFTDEPWIQTSPDFPVPFEIGRPYWVC